MGFLEKEQWFYIPFGQATSEFDVESTAANSGNTDNQQILLFATPPTNWSSTRLIPVNVLIELYTVHRIVHTIRKRCPSHLHPRHHPLSNPLPPLIPLLHNLPLRQRPSHPYTPRSSNRHANPALALQIPHVLNLPNRLANFQ